MKYKYILIIILLTLLTSTLYNIPTCTEITPHRTIKNNATIINNNTEPGWLHTNHNHIETDDGKTFQFKGVAISVLNWGWTDPNRYTSGNWNKNYTTFIKECGANSLRLTINWYQHNQAYTTQIDQVVKWCTENNLRVILDMHLGDPKTYNNEANNMLTIIKNPKAPLNTILTPAQGGAPYPDISWIDLLQYYTSHYANNPTVSMINIMNEPCQDQLPKQTLFKLWYNAAKLATKAIHEINPKILVGVYGMDWGNSLTDFYTNPLPDNNVVYCCEGAYMAYRTGAKEYGAAYVAGNYSQAKELFLTYLHNNGILPMSIKYPVVVIEWGSEQWNGYNSTQDPAYIQFTKDTFEIFLQNKLGSQYWAWDVNLEDNQGLLDYENWTKGILVLNTRGQLWRQYCQTAIL
ncbi:MAG: glycoside hydrolase family 5 protein [Nitrososphaerota archaeon]|jgi:hypothetical protein|nr:glycoside hydrolase family 5 protein [Nitrososphaerota archaeon]